MERINNTINSGNGFIDPSIRFNPRNLNKFSSPRFPQQASLKMPINLVPKESSVPMMNNDGFIHFMHSVTAWKDSTEQYMTLGHLVFAEIQNDAYNKSLIPDIVLSKLNALFTLSHSEIHKKKADKNIEATEFLDFLKNFPNAQQELEAYSCALSAGNVEQYRNNTKIPKMYKISTKERYIHLTRLGIISQYNFMGVIATSGTARNLKAVHERGYEPTITNITLAVSKRVRVANIWGRAKFVKPGAKLFLVLSMDKNGLYQYRPAVTFGRATPRTGLYDHVVHVGVVKRVAAKAPQATTVKNVINSMNNEVGFNALGKSPLIEINVGF